VLVLVDRKQRRILVVLNSVGKGHYIGKLNSIACVEKFIHVVQLSKHNWIVYTKYDQNIFDVDEMMEVAGDLVRHNSKEEAFGYVEKTFDLK
jgi:hypothetical protein